MGIFSGVQCKYPLPLLALQAQFLQACPAELPLSCLPFGQRGSCCSTRLGTHSRVSLQPAVNLRQ